MTNAEVVRILVIGYGNPGRLDDGLGPALAGQIEAMAIPDVTVDSDYQLVLEDAAVVAEHDVVVFIDASTNGPEPFSFEPVEPAATTSFSTHSLSAPAVLGYAHQLFGAKTRGFMLGIRGYAFNEFEERLSDQARSNLAAARAFIEPRLRDRDFPV